MAITDPGLLAVQSISDSFKQTYDTPEVAEWLGHPLDWIRQQPSARVGKIGRLLVKGLCDASGLPAKRTGFSLTVNGKTVQSRFSTGWSVGGFKFEQLRYEKYHAVFCLGITPQRAYAWAIPQDAVFDASGKLLKKPGLDGQHKGKTASDTAWLTVDLASPPTWLDAYGGSIPDAILSLRAILP